MPKEGQDRCVIQVEVWHHDRFSRDQFLGSVHIPLRTLENASTIDWYSLQDKEVDEIFSRMVTDSLRDGHAKQERSDSLRSFIFLTGRPLTILICFTKIRLTIMMFLTEIALTILMFLTQKSLLLY